MATYPTRAATKETSLSHLKDCQIFVHSSFEECESAWRAATTDCACYAFQSFEWLSIWQATVGSAQDVTPFLVHLTDRAGRSLMILPLGIYRRDQLRVLQFLGGGMTDYHAPIVDRTFASEITPSEIADLWSDILRRLPAVDIVWFWNMPETIEGTRNPMVMLAGTRFVENAHAATLPDTFAAFKAARSNDFFKDTRRRERRLAKRGHVEVDVPDTVAGALELVRIMARQKSRRWHETGAMDAFARPGYLEFYEALTRAWLPTGNVHVCGLRVNGEIVATDWGLVFNKRFYSLMAGYEAGEWAQYSLGRILLINVVQWCIDQPKIDIFDLTVGEESYKRNWADHSLRVYEHLAARSAKGMLFVVTERLKTSLRRNPRIRAIRQRLKRKTVSRDTAGSGTATS